MLVCCVRFEREMLGWRIRRRCLNERIDRYGIGGSLEEAMELKEKRHGEDRLWNTRFRGKHAYEAKSKKEGHERIVMEETE